MRDAMEAEELVRKAWSDGLRPDPLMMVSDWSDEYRILSSKSSAEPGRWKTSRAPYAREPMDELSAYSETERVVLMWGAQLGKTEAGNNFVSYSAHYAPGPIMCVQPTLDMAKRLSKQRIAPLIEETPVLKEKFATSKSKDTSNTIMSKDFEGGILVLTGANSAVGLRSMPVRYLFLDEVDAFPQDVEGEGDPVSLAEKRTTTFSRRKILITSTPTIKDMSRVEREYERSDKRKYFVPCPHCGHEQWLRWRGFNDNKDDPNAKTYRLVWTDEGKTKAAYICGDCGAHIEERFKTQMLEAGKWVATSVSEDGKTKGYQLSSLYSPIGWKSWVEILREFEIASKDPSALKTFVNTVLAETWEEAYSAKLDADGLAKRADAYELLTVPEGGLVITAGVDVQINRVEVIQRAWGLNEESWLVNYTAIHGDPSSMELWNQVLDVLNMKFKHPSGAELVTYAAAIDSGGDYTHEVYTFTRQHRKRHLLAIKGQSIQGKPALGKPTKQDINIRKQTIKNGAELWPVGSDTIKALIYGRLKNPDPSLGMYHWPVGLGEQYWKQLTSEKQVIKLLNGFPKKVWVKKDGDANEALDCEVYAYAALQYVYTRHNRATFWQQMSARLKKLFPVQGSVGVYEVESHTDVVVAPVNQHSLSGWKRGS